MIFGDALKYIDKIRRLINDEKGTVKKTFRDRISVALAYPNLYQVGMSNLGFQNIYYLLNKEEDVVCERVFLPDKEDIEVFIRRKIPLFSFESQIPIVDFNILAFSISFEADYINILRILDLAGIPLLSNQRKNYFPIVIAGGVCTFYNPEPLADFIDMFIIGEGEEAIKDFLDEFRNTLGIRGKKEEIVKKFSKIEGIYIPSGYKISYYSDGRIRSLKAKKGYPEKIKKRYIKNIDNFPTSTKIFTVNTEFSDMYLVEIERGCGKNCKFCVTSHVYSPPRYSSKEIIIKDVKKGLQYSNKIGLVGSSLMDHPQIESICHAILKMGGKISVSSLRIDSLSEDFIKCLAASGHKTLSFAPEAGTERLRRFINKEMTDEEIIKGIRLITAEDISHIKLYFLIGIPTETEGDIQGLIDLIKRIKHYILKDSRKKGRLGNITLSINPFVPKPFTPFQWDRMEDVKSLERKLKIIKNGLKKVANVFVIHELPKWSFIQAILSRGDRRVGELLLASYNLREDWRRAIKEVNINPEFYVYRKRDYKEIFPWDHIDVGIEKDYLFNKREKNIRYGE